jgi:alginate O-acetyltransferase complex protein AlgI
MLTMLVSGFWHGPNWQMLLWGAIHGLYLVGERLIMLRRPAQMGAHKTRWPGWGSSLIIFILVTLAWVPFAMRIPNAVGLWKQLLVGNVFGFRDQGLIFPLMVLIPAIWLDWAQYNKPEEIFFLRQPQFIQATMLATAILLILVVTSSGTGQPFVYQGF